VSAIRAAIGGAGRRTIATPTQRPFFAHLPLDVTRAGWADAVQDRIDDGWATGGTWYRQADGVDTYTWDSTWAGMFSPFPDGVDVFLMPPDPAGGAEFVSNMTPQQRNRTWLSNGQEREDNDNTTELRAAFRARSVALKAAMVAAGYAWNPATRTGVRCCVEMNGGVTEFGNHGGISAQIEMIDPDAVDFVGWSSFSSAGGTYAITVVQAIADAMATYWPTLPWGIVAGGINVPNGTASDSPLRTTRAGIADDWYDKQFDVTGGDPETLTWYDVPGFSTGDYGVDSQLLPVLTTYAEMA
jgi:hypothetical protein